MREPTTLFWDIGGVLLTNCWDRIARRRAAEKFGLDWDDFRVRHEKVAAAFETGQITLAQYLQHTVFHRSRAFDPEAFAAFMRSQSQAYPEVLAILERLAGSGRYQLATLNNESRELNAFRIEEFGLRRYFTLFLSSGFLGVMKLDEPIYRLALEVTQRQPDECLFIDDRPPNLECARTLGIRTVHYQNPDQLRDALTTQGVHLA